jgi:Rieske Fe-S protein
MSSPDPDSTPPLWREEISIHKGEESYVSRRQLGKFLALTSFGMLAGNLWILARSLFAKPQPPFPELVLAHDAEIPVGGARLFNYPTDRDPCILVHHAANEYAAYSTKCTHLSCAVVWAPAEGKLECPCHHGFFSVRDGRVLQGPPPRPLPRVLLERREDVIVAVGIATGEEL